MPVVEGFEIVVGDRPDWDYTQPQWRFALARPDGTLLADISEARERSLHFALNRPQTLTLKLDLTHPALSHLLTEEDCLVYAYKQNEHVMTAEVSTLQTVGDDSGEHSVVCVATECPWVRLARRYLGQSTNGTYHEGVDRGNIALWEIAVTNALGGYTGIEGGSAVATSTVNAGPWYYKPVLEAIMELAADAEGYDFWFDPEIPSAANNYRVATFHCAPLRGAVREDVIFEYGHGRHNARQYEWMADLQHRITRAISLPPTYPNNLGLQAKVATDSVTESIPGQVRREDIVQNDLVDDTLRQKLVDEHVAVRKNPRNIYQIQPHVDDGTLRVPRALLDYHCGDIITGRVKDSDILLLDGQVRVYGIDIEIDANGLESVTLTLVDEA